MTPVEDQAAQGRHALDADPVAIGQLGEVVMLDDLQVVEAQGRSDQHRDHQRHQAGDARCQLGNSPGSSRAW